CAIFHFVEQVPTVINVVVRQTTDESVAIADTHLGRKTVCVDLRRIHVVVAFAFNHLVVTCPQCAANVFRRGDHETSIWSAVCHHFFEGVVATMNNELRTRNFNTLVMPVICLVTKFRNKANIVSFRT
ncbi:hypothetical protein D049_0061B, partial [Vibrio parahaemolyticus VPTS-2010]